MPLLLGLLIVLMPLVWLGSEFQDRRWVRIVAGIAALLTTCSLACVVGSLERLNSNSWFGFLTKDFVDGTVVALESGRHQQVLGSLRALQTDYHPTYQNRARYDNLVHAYLQRLKAPTDAEE